MAEVRAMVLAAGLGMRLRPLTNWLPKPLVPLLGVPLLAITFEQLARAGVTRAAVNLHHLPAILRDAFEHGDYRPPFPVEWLEEPVLLGTGGGLRNARRVFDGADAILLVNGDTLIDADFGGLIAGHRAAGAAATLLVRENPDPIAFPPVETDGHLRVRRIAGLPGSGGDAGNETLKPWLFAGVHVLDPGVLELLPVGICDVNRVLHPRLIASGAMVRAVPHHGLWSDVGTPTRYLEATRAALASPPAALLSLATAHGHRLEHGVLWGQHTVTSGESGPERCERSVIGHGSVLGAGVEIRDSVVFPGVEIGAGAVINECILGPLTHIAPHARHEREMHAGGVTATWAEGART